jgi:hypothetical protein
VRVGGDPHLESEKVEQEFSRGVAILLAGCRFENS